MGAEWRMLRLSASISMVVLNRCLGISTLPTLFDQFLQMLLTVYVSSCLTLQSIGSLLVLLTMHIRLYATSTKCRPRSHGGVHWILRWFVQQSDGLSSYSSTRCYLSPFYEPTRKDLGTGSCANSTTKYGCKINYG